MAVSSHRRWQRWRAGAWRLPVTMVVASCVTGADVSWKAAALTSAQMGVALDVPSSPLRPAAALLVGCVALGAVLLLPRPCIPGASLILAALSSNLLSLALWGGVPNPIGVHLAGGMLHLNLADIFAATGGFMLLFALWWEIWQLPDERFARLVTR